MLKSMHKSKNRHFYHIFVSPGDAPKAITLNVVRMEREFDAYKLSLVYRAVLPSTAFPGGGWGNGRGPTAARSSGCSANEMAAHLQLKAAYTLRRPCDMARLGRHSIRLCRRAGTSSGPFRRHLTVWRDNAHQWKVKVQVADDLSSLR